MPTSIKDFVQKIKGEAKVLTHRMRTVPQDLFLGFVIILVAIGAFGLGRLSKIEGAKTPIRIESMPEVTTSTFSQQASITEAVVPATIQNTQNQNLFVASKSGKKYYYPWCPGAEKILEKNRIYFSSKTEAEARGYTPSSACKGL